MNRRFLPLVAILVLVAPGSCGGDVRDFETPEVAGPPQVRMDVVEQHAEQFDGDVPQRLAGSQEEQAAAGYITGTLQQNGYFVRLDAVPVADLVRSTNLIAAPSGAAEPQVVVVVAYSTGSGHGASGLALGLFLEVGRALNVEEPHHAVHMIAVGAEYADVGGGALGSRRLARFMLDEGWDPLVIQLVEITDGGSLKASGDRTEELIEAMTAITGRLTEFDPGSLSVEPDVFASAGFERLLIGGDAEKVGNVLIEYLRRFTQ